MMKISKYGPDHPSGTFFDRWVRREIKGKEIIDAIEEWHDSNEPSVYKYLGLTEVQYAIFLRYPRGLADMRISRVQSLKSFFRKIAWKIRGCFLRK